MFLIKNDVAILHEFLKDDIIRLRMGFKNIFKEQNEEHLDYIKKEEGGIVARILNE